MFNQAVNWQIGYRKEAKPKDRAFGHEWFKTAQELLDNGHVKPHPFKEMTGGLDGIVDGIAQVRKSEVSAMKLVYTI
jgi:aspyridone synthetase trans-acting enoyl reductase